MIYGIKRLNHDEKNLPASFFQPKLLDRGKLRRKLEELNYSPRETEIILDLLREDPDGEVTRWIESGEISEKVREKMKKTGLDFPAAYLEAGERHFSFYEDEIDLGDIKLRRYKPGVLGRFLGRAWWIRKEQEKFIDYEVYRGQENIGDVSFYRVSEEEIEIPTIEISRKYRGNHYATRILKWAIRYFKKKGYKKISLDSAEGSPDAIHIYEKLGFVKIKQISKGDIFGGLTRMELKL